MTRNRLFAGFVLSCLVAACGQPDPAPEADSPADEQFSAGPTEGSESPDPKPSGFPAPDTLVGEYRVAGIDGKPLDAQFGIAVSIDPIWISLDPRCSGHRWRYSYGDGTIGVARAPMTEEDFYGAGGKPVPLCRMEIRQEELAFIHALDAVVSAERTPENGILLSGGGRSVTLFSQ